jgi:hypothetical protein
MGYTTTWTVQACDTDAHFRANIQAVHDFLSNVGLVQTGDTGQVNPATVTVASGGGFEIWRFADTAEGTAPVYVLLNYGIQSGNFKIIMSVGVGSTGSGALTNPASSPTTTTIPAAAAGGTAYACGSMSEGRLIIVWPNHSNGALLHIERLRDSSGAPSAEGTWWYNGNSYWGGGGGAMKPAGSADAFSAVSDFTLPILGAREVGTWGDGTDIGVAVLTPFLFKPRRPLLSLVAYRSADIADLTEFALSRYGTSRNYKAMGNGPTNIYAQSGSGAARPAILWE